MARALRVLIRLDNFVWRFSACPFGSGSHTRAAVERTVIKVSFPQSGRVGCPERPPPVRGSETAGFLFLKPVAIRQERPDPPFAPVFVATRPTGFLPIMIIIREVARSAGACSLQKNLDIEAGVEKQQPKLAWEVTWLSKSPS
jgi:hypothetical protein